MFVKFRRKAEPTQAPDESAPSAAGETTAATGDETAAPVAPTGSGPFDESEVAGDGVERVDLGSLLVAPTPGRELRLQVDEPTGTVQAVMLAGPDGALEFQAFAAPRNGDLWSTVRPQIAADIARRGGTTTEREGRFGTELLCQVPVQRPDGTPATQPSRIIGVNGDRWMLRASLLGRPALEPDGAEEWEDALAQVVVRRGSTAMPVGEPLPVVLPEQARRVN
ncbi:hypothetical protein ASG88_18670 [Nocardioides sp. Soil777]|nr:hypothetical protein ASG88_18670 [Nocardioides sp. Soil777]